MFNWIESTFGVSDGATQVIAVILALVVVLLLFGLFIFLLKRLSGSSTPQSRNRQPRIAVMDAAAVDTKRRLVLIRRDNVEHLLLIGGPSDVVVEQNIVRNTPLPTGRNGSYMAGTASGPAAIKSPMAPGPDLASAADAQEEPEAPKPESPAARVFAKPAATAISAAAALAERPAPSSPDLADDSPSSPDHSGRPFPEQASATAAPVLATRPSAVQAAAVAAPAAPQKSPAVASPEIVPASSRENAPDGDIGTGTADSANTHRAAGLLHAATQNGFNRTTPKTGQSQKSTEPVAPAVKVEPAQPADIKADEAEEPAGKAASTLKSLARPFSSRERPNYGNQSITPPASGPAARAKTALLKPVEPAQGAEKIEPSLGSAETKPAEATQTETPKAAAPVAAGVVTGFADRIRPAAKRESMAAPSVAEPDKTAETDIAASEPLTVAAAAQAAPEAAPKIDVEELFADVAPDIDTSEHPGKSAEVIQLDVEELLEDDAPSADIDDTAAGNTETDEQAQTQTATASEAPALTTAADRTPRMPGAPEVKAEPRQAAVTPLRTQSLSDKNPIEDEMAKILDELGGQHS